jgi:hypothetical protein
MQIVSMMHIALPMGRSMTMHALLSAKLCSLISISGDKKPN